MRVQWLQGLPGKLVRQQSKQLLEQVRLTGVGRLRSGSYSGGMKRRLSVACALLGDPHIVFLDEPTTGMDPISRRHVWDIIETAKAGHLPSVKHVQADKHAAGHNQHTCCQRLHLAFFFSASAQLVWKLFSHGDMQVQGGLLC